MTAPDEYDVLDITEANQILTPEELGEPEPEAAAEEAPAEPEAEPEEAAESDVSEDIAEPEGNEETAEPEDELVDILTGLCDSISAMAARLDAMETRLAESEAREAARGKKLTGFFAPVPDGKNPEPDGDSLPRIEKKYIY